MGNRKPGWAFLAIIACGGLAAMGQDQDRGSPGDAGAAIAGLKAEDVDARRAAAARVRDADATTRREALPALIGLLMNEKDGQVRLAVLDAVTFLGPEAEPAIPALVHTLRTDYGGQRLEEQHQDYRSALALAAIGKSAVEPLRGLLDARRESVRAEVVMALGRIGPDAAPAAPDLIKLLGDRGERIRREAAQALGKLGPAAIEPLIAVSEQGDIAARGRAVEALGHLPASDERVRRVLLECARDAAPEVRGAAVRSLARLDVPDDALRPVVEAALRDEDGGVRLAMVNLLAGRRALLAGMAEGLASLLASENEGIARHAAFLLREIGPEAAPRLLDALRGEGARIDLIAEALAQIGRPIVPLLMQAAGAPEPRVRRGAALALGQVRPLVPEVVKRLAGLLDDPDPEVKGAALAAIGFVGPRAGEAVPAVRARLRDESAAVRAEAITILFRAAPRDDRLLEDLASALDDADAGVQRRAIETLRILGPSGRKVLAPVIGKLESGDPEVRLAAAEMIGSHGRGAAEAVPKLIPLLDDPAPEIRAVAAQTLGKLGEASQPAFPRLVPLLKAEQAEVRGAAASALGSLDLGAEELRPHLAGLLRDGDPEVRRAAQGAIQRLGPRGALFIPDIILMAEDKENLGSVQRLLRRYERRGPDARSLPELVKQLEHDQDAVRLLAIKFLGLAGASAKEAIPALERLREDPSAEVRKQAEEAAGRIGGDPEPGR